jgi:hypothetical protein
MASKGTYVEAWTMEESWIPTVTVVNGITLSSSECPRFIWLMMEVTVRCIYEADLNDEKEKSYYKTNSQQNWLMIEDLRVSLHFGHSV